MIDLFFSFPKKSIYFYNTDSVSEDASQKYDCPIICM